MSSRVQADIANYGAKLFKRETEVCQVLAFRLVMPAPSVVDDPPRVPAVCCFTVPLASPIHPGDGADYELVFDNGARFPIRVREVSVRMDGLTADGRDILAELM